MSPLNEEGIAQGQGLRTCPIWMQNPSGLYQPPDPCPPYGRNYRRLLEASRTSVFELPELIERDMGIYSGKYMKNQAEFFAISASPDSEGMEPFSQVLKRMKQALQIIARSGLESGRRRIPTAPPSMFFCRIFPAARREPGKNEAL